MVLKTEERDKMIWATVHRPETHNAVNFKVMDAFEDLLDQLEQSDRTRVLVLNGAGDSFISGGDLREFHTLETQEEAASMAQRMMNILERIEQLPCWTIACVNGPAYGGGCEIMLAFDFRIASHVATFGFTQGRFYLPPGWGGLTRLVERVGRSTALRWLAGEKVVDAEEAMRHKLVDRVEESDQLLTATLDWVRTLGKNDRDYIRTLKEGGMRFAEHRWEAIESEIEPFTQCWVDERHLKRVERFINREKG